MGKAVWPRLIAVTLFLFLGGCSAWESLWTSTDTGYQLPVAADHTRVMMDGFTIDKRYATKTKAPADFSRSRIRAFDKFEGPPLFGEYSGPLVIGDLVIAGSTGHSLTAIDRETSEVVWSMETKGRVYTTPAYKDGMLFFGDDDGNFYGSDLTGKKLWEINVVYPIVSSPLIMGELIFFITSDQRVFAYNAKDGNPLWKYGMIFPDREHIWSAQSLAGRGDNLYVGLSDGYIISLSVEHGVVKWKERISTRGPFTDVTAGPTLGENLVYAGTREGDIVAFDISSGRKVWETQESAQAGFALADGALFFGTKRGEAVALDALTGEPSWKVMVEGISGGTPSSLLYADGELLIAFTGGGVHALDAKTGEVKRSYRPGAGVNAPLHLDEKGLILHTNAGNLHFLDADR